MRAYGLAAMTFLAGLGVGAALMGLARHPPQQMAGAPAPAEQTVVNRAPSTAPTTAEPQAPAPGPEVAAEAPAAPVPAAPALPSIDVAPHAVHTVPDDAPEIPTVTLLDRNGRTREIKPPPPAPSYQVSAAPAPYVPPRLAPTASRSAAAPAPVPPLGASPQRPAAPVAAFFNGSAAATGATALSIGGRVVRLFGIRVADPRDQCGIGPGDNRSCAVVARDALAQRLQHYPTVACHVPAIALSKNQHGDPGVVCTDASGTDLGGFLVAEGYALADRSQSVDYSGAEGVARTFRRGLWRYR